MIELDGFTETSFTFDGVTRPVYRGGTGPGVVVVHEVPGITPLVADFGRRVVDAGFTVAMPSLLGEPGKAMSFGYIVKSFTSVCISKEFSAWAANRTSPVITWLRALARDLHAQAGGPGVGALGMCFSGGFVLAMAVDDELLAPVMSQPSMPFPVGKARSHSLGLSDADLARVKDRVANQDLCILGLRFSEDRAVPDARWTRYTEEFGDHFIGVDIDSSSGNPHGIKRSSHSVLTEHLVDEPGHPTRDGLDRVLAFFRERLASRPAMRFVVYGAGAIGGVVGARLFQAGHDVVLIARGAHYEAIRERGLRIKSPLDDETLPIPVVDHPSRLTLTADDVVFLAMKSQDTIDACAALDTCAPADIAVACFQNGVENERVVLRHYAGTYAVCVMSPTSHIDPGVVIAQSAPVSGLFDIGCYPQGLDTRAEAIAVALNASTFHSVPRADVMRWKYTKLLMNLANSIEATVTPGPEVKELARRVRTEGETTLRAAGIDFASRDEDKERRGDRMHVQPVDGEMRGGGSSWQSLARATGSIEADYLNGEIVTLGRIHGVPTPANALMQRVANAQARAGAPPQSVPVARLLTELG